ncbi:hypothetical protein ACAX43_30030 [Paraburkholderia sp. IW21]|uniref:hypothetical protein n=1 Tax=Paraburkholderia sp. IW21 TaxID=3242488 RepID=UPI00351FF151
MELRWKILLQRPGTDETVPVCSVTPPSERRDPADFGLSLAEGRQLLATLQKLVTRDQINAYDKLRRECGRYRRIKDWRSRIFSTALGRVQVKVYGVTAAVR